jgi:hypothetical protein
VFFRLFSLLDALGVAAASWEKTALALAPSRMDDGGAKRIMNGRPKLVFLIVVFLIIPLVVGVLSAFFGALLALVEEWEFFDGFLYVTQNLVGIAVPLTDVTVSSGNIGGELFDLLVAVWSLSVSGAAIGVIGALALNSIIVDGIESKIARFSMRSKVAHLAAHNGGMTLADFRALVASDPTLSSGTTNRQIDEIYHAADKNLDDTIKSNETGTLMEALRQVALNNGKASNTVVSIGGVEQPLTGTADSSLALRKEVADLREEVRANAEMLKAILHKLDVDVRTMPLNA